MSLEWKVNLSNSLSNGNRAEYSNTIETYIWIIEISSIFACIVLFLLTANRISEEKYFSGALSMVASIIAGISPYLASVFIF